MKMSKLSWVAVGATALSFMLAGCAGDDEPVIETGGEETGNEEGAKSMVRVVHASPDAPAVDVWAVGVDSPLIADLAYGETSDYLELPEGDYTIELRAAGSAGDTAAAYTQELSVPGDATITTVASGLLGGSGDTAFRILALAEGFNETAAGESIVRIVHASATAPTVAIDVGNDGTAEIEALAPFADTGAEGVALPSDTALQIGIWADGNRVTAFTTPALPEGGEIFVIATGLLENPSRTDEGFNLLAVAPSGTVGFVRQNPYVYALHASPNAPAVDVFAGDAELVDDLAFGEISAPIQVPPGAYDLDFFGHEAGATRPGGDAAATASTPGLEGGLQYMAIATGFLGGSPSFTLLPIADGFDSADTNARLRVIHASPDAPAVDVGTVAGGVLTPIPEYSGLDYLDVSPEAGLSLPEGSYDLGVAVAGSTDPVFTFSGVGIAAGARLFAVAAGSLTDGTFQLVAVDATAAPWGAAALTPDP